MNLIGKLINNTGLYNWLRFSSVPETLIESLSGKTDKNVTFYSSFLTTEVINGHNTRLVFDIGANKGNKTKAFLKMGLRVVCLEPEMKSLETLRFRFGSNKNVTIVNKGVSDKVGSSILHIQDARSGYNTLSDKWVDALKDGEHNRWSKPMEFVSSYKIETTTLDNLIAEFGQPLFVKIDVEGYELAVIKGLTQTVPFISFEANLPEFTTETIAIAEYLNGLSINTRFFIAQNDILNHTGMTASELKEYLSNTDARVVEVIAASGK